VYVFYGILGEPELSGILEDLSFVRGPVGVDKDRLVGG
jgi:hypothetical protein